MTQHQDSITASDTGKATSGRSALFCKKAVLENFAKLTGKHLCQGLFFNKALLKK